MGAHAQHRVHALQAVERRAAGAGTALVAGRPGGVAEIVAARPLQHVAAEGRHVAQLGAGRQREALGQHGIMLDDRRVVGGGRHLGQGADP